MARNGQGREGKHLALGSASPQYIGGILEMANSRLYRFWADLTPALKTGEPQNEIKETGKSLLGEIYADLARLEQFMDGMSGISMGNFMAVAEKFNFSGFKTLADMGGATGQLSSIVASCRDSPSLLRYASAPQINGKLSQGSSRMRTTRLDCAVQSQVIVGRIRS